LSDFRQCPLKFKLKYLEKAANFKEDASKSPHLVRGGNVHKALENYVIKRRAGEEGIPVSSLQEVESSKPLVNKLMEVYDLHPEHQIAINDKFQLVDWFSNDAWFRVIFDLIGFGSNLLLGDWKTGKLTDYSGTMAEPGQLHYSALVGMAVWPQYNEVLTSYFYVDHKHTHKEMFTREEHFDSLKKALIHEHNEVNSESTWAPCVNEYCKWCQATKDQCSYSRKVVIPGH
jgi:hypothetical protein